jgi:hypothetical protein
MYYSHAIYAFFLVPAIFMNTLAGFFLLVRLCFYFVVYSLLSTIHKHSCGIVLCSRDAKFAVDCDTCRLSYCLVCLASGSKDPCVRCGHRPSKRMEQLVHLRLKSIYKAFKQSSSGRSSSDSNGGGPLAPSSRIEELNDGDDDDIPDLNDGSEHYSTDDPQTLLQAAASAAKMVAAESRHEHHDHISAEENIARYMEEKERADAVAAALVAELDGEENAAKTKKSKKKRKKARNVAKKEVEVVEEHGDDDDDDDATAASASEFSDQDQKQAAKAFQEDFSGDEEAVESIDVAASLSDVPDGFGRSGGKSEEKATKTVPLVDPLEEKLCMLVADYDIEGLEELLASIKGVPGRAALRKNTKKAMKRLRLEELEENGSDILQSESYEAVNDIRPGAATPPALGPEMSGANSDLLKVVSYMHNKPAAQPAATGNSRPRGASTAGRSECVMHMAPLIVGWVIGKGGQRIRDLMEESGARVWIDQDSMGVQDARIVYVSGNRSNVDVAVQMIKELVSKAPAGTPLSKRNTPLADATTSSKHPPTSTKLPLLPDSLDMMTHEEHLGLKPRENVSEGPPRSSAHGDTGGRSKHVMTCDPRFVPLLIGRRGWTIKHIQDTSGARVDIDQTVTPRKITLSGSEDNVEIAIRMVSDVLSYPHSQLQGGVEGDGPPGANEGGKISNSPNDTHAVMEMQQNPPPTVQQALPTASAQIRPHSPPPSSLIMTGDAKSTISASSSLSSTPEPSMSSAAKGPYHQVAPGPMLPPAYGRNQGAPPTNDMAAGSFNRMQPPSPMANAPIFPGGLGMPNQESLFGPSPGFMQQQGHGGGPMLPEQHQGNHIGRPPQSYAPRQDMPPFHQAPSQGFGPIPGNHHMPMHQHGSFHSSQPGFQMSTPESQRSVLNDIGKPDNRAGPSPGGMWDLTQPHPVSSIPQLPGSEGFHLDAAVDFLEHSKQQKTNSMQAPSGVNGLIGLSSPVGQAAPIGRSRRHGAQSGMLPRTGEESLMVDSLFAPAERGRNDSNILTGLQGLSINNEGLGGGMWGSSNVGNGDGGGVDTLSLPVGREHGADPKDESGLFTAVQPTLATHENHPSRSRFAWGAPLD